MQNSEQKQQVITAITATNSWCVKECLAIVEQHDDMKLVMLPVSMCHLQKIINQIVWGK